MPETGPAAPHPQADSGAIELSLLLVTHNSRHSLDDLVRSLREHPPGRPWELRVADNASTDQAVEFLEGNIRESIVMRHSENRGFAAGVNAAAKDARGSFYAIINPDIAWDSDPFAPLIQLLESRPRAGAVVPQLVFPDGRPQLSIRRFPNHRSIWRSRGTPWASLLRDNARAREYTQDYPDQPARIEAAAAACMMVSKGAFEAVGGMDDGYFLYVEDTDLCRRLLEAGREVWCDPTIRVQHAWSAASHRNAWHARQHRRSLRRYFGKFYTRHPLKNAALFGALRCADILDWLRRPGPRSEP